MLFRFSLLFLLLIHLFAGCRSEESVKKSKMPLQNVLPEDVLQGIQDRLQSAEQALDSNKLSAAYADLDEVAQLYVDYQQWDSLYLINRKVFLQGFSARNYDRALPFFDRYCRQIPLDQDTIKAKLLELTGFSYYSQGRLPAAGQAYHECAKIWEQHYLSKSLLNSYNMLGIIYTTSGEFQKAIKTYQSALISSKPLKDTLLMEAYLDNLGKAFIAENNFKAAIQSYKKAKQLGVSKSGKYELRLAEAYLEDQQLGQAASFARQALNILLEKEEETDLPLPTLYQTLAEISLLKKEIPAAFQYAQQAVRTAKKAYPAGHREIGKAHIYLGEAYQMQGRLLPALQQLQAALQMFVPGFQPSTIREFPDQRLLNPDSWLMVCLKIKGQLFEDRYQRDNDPKDLQSAADHYQLAIHYINQTKQYYTQKASKTYWGAYSTPYIEKAINAQLRLHQADGISARLDTAFQLAQSANAFLLREHLQEQEALQFGGVPKDTAEAFREQRQEIRQLREALSITQSLVQKDSLIELLFQKSRTFEKLNESILHHYPDYEQIKYDLPVVSIREATQALQAHELLVKYFMGKDQLYCFAMTKTQQQVYPIALDSSLIQQMSIYRQSISDLDYVRENPDLAEDQFLESAHFLYQKLLAPALNDLAQKHTTLVIVPDDIIGYLTFDCLLQRPADTWLDAAAFLIHDYAIRYHYAAGLIGPTSATSSDPDKGFLGFGIEYNTMTLDELQLSPPDSIANKAIQDAMRGKKFGKLRYADDEVLAIASGLIGKTFLNERATKENFLTHSPSYSLIHIAAHSFIGHEENYPAAYLVFTPSQKEDYLLSLSEVYGLRLNADLVVLSACQTGAGELLQGEGVMSLARAFQVAGSRSMLASQWSISDQTSAIIMKEFYRQLKTGLNKSEALRKAKLKYLNSDQLSSPAFRIPGYWAAGILVGDDQALNLALKHSFGFWWIIAGGLLVFLWIWGKRKA